MSTKTAIKDIKRRRIDWEIEQHIRECSSQGASPAQIRKDLFEKFPETETRKIPDQRVIRDIAREHTAEDRSGAWQLGDSEDTAGAKAVLAAMAAVNKYGYNATITRSEAEWIARIAPHADYGWEEDWRAREIAGSQPAPGLEPHSLWILARQYLACEANRRPTLAIDLLLAFKPWRDESWRTRAYQETLNRLGLKPLTYLWLLPEWEHSDE